jgi:hypothetical protein
MLSKEQAISRQKAYIRTLEHRLVDEQLALNYLEQESTKEQWYITDVVDPWGG